MPYSAPAPAANKVTKLRSLSPEVRPKPAAKASVSKPVSKDAASRHATPAPVAVPVSVPAPVPAPVSAVASSREQTPAVAAVASPAPEEEEVTPPEPEIDEEEAARTIDMETFHQILDLDEDDTHDFSKGMAWAYFSQANTTFVEMDEAYSEKDLEKLSSLGHFLKGSSAALGVAKVQASCEQIQHYGQLRDEEAGIDLTAAAALQKIAPILTRVKAEYSVAESWLKKWYEEHCGPEEEEDDES